MGCTTIVQTADCFGNRWKLCRGVYWSINGARAGRYANIIMSRTGGSCPSSGHEKRFYLNQPDTFDEFTVKVFYAGDSIARIEVWETSELTSEPIITVEGFGFASVKGLINTAFDTPCEEKDIIGEYEAVNVFGSVSNNSLLNLLRYKINVSYDRPNGERAFWSIAGSELGNGTFKYFGYTEDKYIAGEYSNLTVNVDIL